MTEPLVGDIAKDLAKVSKGLGALKEVWSFSSRVAALQEQYRFKAIPIDKLFGAMFGFGGAPGAYDVNVRLGNPGAAQNGLKLQETNLHVRLEIGARDPEKLKQRAASLADRASNNSNYEEAAFAALTLGYMNDPAAVPYLEKILTANTMVTPLVIMGLERIGGREAAQVLLTALNVQRGETGQLIRAALSNIERNTTDPELKGKIRNAL